MTASATLENYTTLTDVTGLATRVAKLVVGSKNHQDFHNALLP